MIQTVEKAISLTKRAWFIALARFAMVGLIPATMTFAGWLVLTVNNSQLTLAGLTVKVETVDARVAVVDKRVDNLDDSLAMAERERTVRRDKLAEQTAAVASRLTALETGQANMVKSLDRLINLLDNSRTPPPR